MTTPGFSGQWEKALDSLELIRQGSLVEAAHRLHQTDVVSPHYQSVENEVWDKEELVGEGLRYFRNWTDFLGFLQRMEQLATRLEEYDL